MYEERKHIRHFRDHRAFSQRVILSLLSGSSLRLTDIRKSTAEPGLKDYEINLIRLIDKITNGTLVEIDETGTSVFFQPGFLQGGDIQHQCCKERSIGYYLQVLLMLGPFCKLPINAILKGVTNNNIDPSPDVVKNSMLAIMRKFMQDSEGLNVKIVRRGVLPLGGGEVHLYCPIVSTVKSIHLLDCGQVKRIRGTAYALRTSPSMAVRIALKAKGVFLKYLRDIYINTDGCKGKQGGESPGFGAHLMAETTQGVIYSSEMVSEPNAGAITIPEDLGECVAKRLLSEILLGGMTDTSSQALAILFMALGPPDISQILLGPLTPYSTELLRLLNTFIGVKFDIKVLEGGTGLLGKAEEASKAENDSVDNNTVNREEERPTKQPCKLILSCKGIGLRNINKRML